MDRQFRPTCSMLICLVVVLAGCGKDPEPDHASEAQRQLGQLQAELATTRAELSRTLGELAAIRAELAAAQGELQRAREKLSSAEQGSAHSVREARLAGADRQAALDGKDAAESDLYVFAAVAFSAVIAALFVTHRLVEEQRSRMALSRFLRWLSRRRTP